MLCLRANAPYGRKLLPQPSREKRKPGVFRGNRECERAVIVIKDCILPEQSAGRLLGKFGHRTPAATSVCQYNHSDRQHKIRNSHSPGYTQQTCSQTEGLAKVFVTRRKTTALGYRGVRWKFMGQLFNWEGPLHHKRPTGMMSIFWGSRILLLH